MVAASRIPRRRAGGGVSKIKLLDGQPMSQSQFVGLAIAEALRDRGLWRQGDAHDVLIDRLRDMAALSEVACAAIERWNGLGDDRAACFDPRPVGEQGIDPSVAMRAQVRSPGPDAFSESFTRLLDDPTSSSFARRGADRPLLSVGPLSLVLLPETHEPRAQSSQSRRAPLYMSLLVAGLVGCALLAVRRASSDSSSPENGQDASFVSSGGAA